MSEFTRPRYSIWVDETSTSYELIRDVLKKLEDAGVSEVEVEEFKSQIKQNSSNRRGILKVCAEWVWLS